MQELAHDPARRSNGALEPARCGPEAATRMPDSKKRPVAVNDELAGSSPVLASGSSVGVCPNVVQRHAGGHLNLAQGATSLLGPMVLVVVAQTPKSPRIVAHQDRTHMVCERSLPRIIFTHAAHCAPLDQGHLISVHPVDSLPRVAPQIVLDGFGITGSLQYFCKGHW